MLGLKKSRISVPAAVLYAVIILYLSLTSGVENIRHIVNIIMVHGTRDILIACNLSFFLKFPVNFLNFANKQSIDLGHVGIYFGFGILLYFAFVTSKNQVLTKYSSACAICIGTAYGILNELFQLYFPYRIANIADAFSNLLGLVLSQVCLIIFISVFRYITNRNTRIDGSLN